MRNKSGPRKKPGDRYPSGDLKPVIPPAIWGRIRDIFRDQRLSSELGRLWLHRELTDTQAAAGFLLGDIYRSGNSVESSKLTNAVTADPQGDHHVSEIDRKAIDDFLLGYPPKLSEAVIELCVLNRTVDWRLRPDVREVLDHVAELWPDAMRQQAVILSKLGTGGFPRRRNQPEDTELTHDIDPDAEVLKKVIAMFEPDMDAGAKARLIDHYLALRDREEFREEKIAARDEYQTPAASLSAAGY